MAKYLLIILLLAGSNSLSAQQSDLSKEAHSHLRVFVALGHSLYPNHSGNYLYIPSVCLDIEYFWNENWGLGWHNDLEIQNFETQESDFSIINRSYPLVSTLDVLYKVASKWVVFGGPGVEFDPQKTFFVLRCGAELEFSAGNGWDFGPTVFYDYRVEAYDTFTIAFGVGKTF